MAFIFDKAPSSLLTRFNRSLEILHAWAQDNLAFPDKSWRSQHSAMFLNKERVVLAIDCSEQRVQSSTSKEIENLIFSGKYMEHTFTILVGCSPDGKVILVSKTYCGRKTDAQVLHFTELWKFFEKDEFIVADEGFPGLLNFHESTLIKNHPSEEFSKNLVEFNRECDRRRIVIENVFAWVKKFGITRQVLRFKKDLNQNSLQISLDIHNKIWCCILAFLNVFGKIRNE